jgi:hypothetical protein
MQTNYLVHCFEVCFYYCFNNYFNNLSLLIQESEGGGGKTGKANR